jgi:O-antigen ligase
VLNTPHGITFETAHVPPAAREVNVHPAARIQLRHDLTQLLAAAFLMLVVLGPLLSFSPNHDNTGDGNAMRQISYLAVFIATAVVAHKRGTRLQGLPLTLVLALGWCWLSVTWAVDPVIAVRRLTLTTIVVLTVFFISRRLGYQATIRALRIALVAALLANYAAVFGWPEVGIHQLGPGEDPGLVGDWRGIAQHKNFAGPMCAFTVLLFALDAREIRRLLRWSVVVAAGYFLFQTGSKTSMGILGVSLAAGWPYRRYNPRYRVYLIPATLLLGIVVTGLLYNYAGALATAFARPDALTGRVQIWPVLLAYSQDHWLGGSGYGSFWNVGPASPVYKYITGWVSEIVSGHNGYLDLLVQVGVPGLLLTITAAIVLPLARLLSSLTVSRHSGALLTALIVFCAGHNVTESSLLDRDALVQVVLMFAVALEGPVTTPARRRIANAERPTL